MSDPILVRSSLLFELSQVASYASRKEKSFKAGSLNRHTPREGYWLPPRIKAQHHEGIFRRGPKGKRRKRRGSFLRDEPFRKRAEPIRRRLAASLDLERTHLLIDDHTPT